MSDGEAGGTVPRAPDGSSTCQEPCDQELEVRHGGSWLLGGRARGGSAEGGRSQALGPGRRCHLHPHVPSSLPSLFSGLQSLPHCCPTQGRALKNSDADTFWVREGALFGGHNTTVPAAGAPLLLRHSGLCVAPSHSPRPAVLTERPPGRAHSPGFWDLGLGYTAEGLVSPQVAAVAPAKTATFCSGVPVCQTWGTDVGREEGREEGVSGLLIKRNSIVPVEWVCDGGWICPLLTPSLS